MSLRLSGYAIAFVQTGIEPLWAIGHTSLVKNAVDKLIIKHLGILGRSKIAVAFAPNSPAVSHTVCYLLHACFTSGCTIRLWYTGFAEILLGKDVSSNLAPLLRHFYIVHLKHYLTAWIADNAGT